MALIALVLTAAVAVAVGRAAGGEWGLRQPKMRGWPLLLAALLVQGAAALLGATGYRVGLALSAVLAGVYLAWNRRQPGVVLLALGLLLNVVVVAANGAMPVSTYAAARAGVEVGTAVPPGDPRHVLASADTRLGFLGDVVPVALPPRREVVSVGDCLLAAGLGLLVMRTLRPRRARRAAFGRRAARRAAAAPSLPGAGPRAGQPLPVRPRPAPPSGKAPGGMARFVDPVER